MKKINICVKLQSLAVYNIIAFYNVIEKNYRFKTISSIFIARNLRKIIFHVVFSDYNYSLDILFENNKNSDNADNLNNLSLTKKIYEIVNLSTRRENYLFNQKKNKDYCERTVANDNQ